MRSHGAAFAFDGEPSRDISRRFLERALRERSPDAASLIISVPAPVAPPDALLRAFPSEARILWDPPKTAACAGLGVAKSLPPRAPQVDDFFETAHQVADAASPAPRVFGGASFAPGSAAELPWDSFGDGFLVLPTWTYQVDQRAWLSFATCDEVVEVDRILDVFDILWGNLERPIGVIPSPVSAHRVSEVDRATWSRQVNDIRQQIRADRFEKVVAARHCVVQLETGAGSLDVLERLEQRFPGCTRFALWSGEAAFLGATPELLIARRGNRVLSEALAGSTAHGDVDRMMKSDKEREEHRIVVRAILEGLGPFCESLRSDAEPSVRELPNLLHMQTAIEGRLAAPTHILSLVQALHPTPAVGGVPTAEAIDWILEHEELARGWYSAPVGWTDAAGDGEFVVALRSGLLRDGKAWVYAGAGIMADSDPDAEYSETELKMQALLGALHGDAR